MYQCGRRTERSDLKAHLLGSGITPTVAGFQSLAMLPLPEEDRAWAGQLSDLGTLSRSQGSIPTSPSREVVTLSKQDNSRNVARGAATTIRISEKGEMKETEVLGKWSWQGMSNQQAKEKELCGLYTNLLHKNTYLFCIFITLLNVRHDAVKVPRSCVQTKIYPVCYSCTEQIMNYSFLTAIRNHWR